MAKAPAPKAPPKKEKSPAPPPEEEDDFKKDDKGDKDAEAPKGGGKLKLIILIVAALAVGVGGAVGVMKLLGGSPSESAGHGAAEIQDNGEEHAPPPVAPQRASGGHGAPAESGGHGGGGEGLAEPSGPINVEFKSFIVNLNDMGGRRMLKLTMSVEVESQELADEVNAKMPQLRDILLLLLSSIQSDDVSGLDGKQRLKNQMLNRINPALSKGKIRNLYFSEIVVQ
jgi:flagellar FliL protein